MNERLEAVLDARNETEFDAALRHHGPIDASALGHLERAATSGPVERRVHATRLVALVRAPDERPAALARIARETDAVAVWGVAVDALFSDAPALARDVVRERPEWQRLALERSGVVFRAGLRAALASGDAGTEAVVRARIDDRDGAVRRAVVEAIDPADLARFETLLLERLWREPRLDVATRIAGLLLRSDNRRVQGEIMEWYWAGDEDRRNAVTAMFRKHPRRWLRDDWLEAARDGGVQRRRALEALCESGGEELLPVCLAVYEDVPHRGEAGFVDATLDRAPCDRIVSRLAGRELRGEAAETWLRSRLRRDGPGERTWRTE